MIEALKGSRKLTVFIASLVVYIGVAVANAYLSSPIPQETVDTLVTLVLGWLVSQGIADHGSQGAANAAKRAVNEGQEVVDIVKAALDNKTETAKTLEG
tara:strand:+ start:1510 stop:1806 length:297 start_codon:yes stop_codon:yes gene_type:complete